MSNSFAASGSLQLQAKDTQSDDALRDTTDTGTLKAGYTLTDGTAGLTITTSKSGGLVVKASANEAYTKQLTIAASGSQTIDLSGSVTDAFGNTISLTRIVAIAIINTSPDCSVTVGNAASNPFLMGLGGTTPTINIRPGGSIILFAPDATGYTVTGGSADNLKFAVDSGGAGPAIIWLQVIGVKA